MEQVGELILGGRLVIVVIFFFPWMSPKKMVGPHISIVSVRYQETEQMLSAPSRHEVDVCYFTTYSDVTISQFVHELCITPHQASKTQLMVAWK